MSGVERLADADSGSPVSNGCDSPQSPECSTILDTPLTLDFDPMSFQFQELANAATSPTSDEDSRAEDRNSEPIIIKSANYTNPSLNVFDPLVTSDLDLAPQPQPQSPPSDVIINQQEIPECQQQAEVQINPEQSSNNVNVNGTLEVTSAGPDILDNPAISNPNPDLVLIDAVTVVPASGTGGGSSGGSDDSRPPSEKSGESTTSSSEMIDLLGSSSTNEHVDSSVVQCVDVVTVTSYASSVESTGGRIIKEESHQQHSDQESDVVDGDSLAAPNKHDVFEDNLMHEETLSSDSESDSRAKLVAKKNLTATTTQKKKISSTSSESSVSEHESGTKQSKEIIMKKSNVTRVEEKSNNMITSTKTSSVDNTSVTTIRSNKPLNGVENKIDLNGTRHRKNDSESSESSDEEVETPKIECPISVTKLDDSHSPPQPNDSEDLQTSPKEVVLAVDLKSLGIINKPPIVERKQSVNIAAKKQLSNFKSVQRNQYVMHAEQEIPVSPTKEIAVTNVDLQSLKSSYSKSNSVNEDDMSKESKEIISTGIDIKQLKHSFANGSIPSVSEENIYKEAETIETSISVRSLKTSFNKSNEEVENYVSAPVEEVKPSVDRAQVTRKFSQEVESLNASVDEHGARGNEDDKCLCKICEKHVYQMEKVKAEKAIFHKNCFRCKECAKQLTVDAYNSHEGQIYCKQHFKQIFEPKPRFEGEDIAPTENMDHDDLETEEGKQRRNEMIIRENTPVELPPDVVRSETKSNDLESLPNLNLSNIKSRFESQQDEPKLPSVSDLCTLSRSPSIMARLAKYQSALSKEGQTNGDLSGDEDQPEQEHDPNIVRETRQREKVNFAGLSSLKDQWESGNVNTAAEEAKEDVKDDLAKLRQRICLGRSESMKAVYEKACQDTKTKSPVRSESVVLGRDVKALSIKDKFEKGAIENDEEIEAEKFERLRKEKEEDLSVLTEPGTAVDARSLFKQMDASVKSPSPTQLSPSKSPSMIMRTHNDSISSQASEGEIVKGSAPTDREEIPVETTVITQKFKFFENYKEEEKERKRFQITPPREITKEPSPEPEAPRDPNIVRSTDIIDDLPVTDTAKKMLDKFKALENQSTQEHVPMPTTPKPLKRITPPREDGPKVVNVQVDTQPQVDPDIVRCSYKSDDDIVVEADKAKSLRAKFENWELEVSRENLKNEKLGLGMVDVSGNGVEETDFLPQVDTTKNLKAKFEAIKDETAKTPEKPKPKARRFIQEQQSTFGEACNICEKRLYPLEKMETSGMKFHKNCFRCAHCNCLLRLDNFTTSAGKLFCTPHFKQLFISKGNYDEGFGREKISEKWNRSRSSTPTPRENGDSTYTNGHVEEMV